MPKNFFAALDSDEEERTTAPAPAKKAAKPAAAAAPRARGTGSSRGGSTRAAADYRANRDTRGSERRQYVALACRVPRAMCRFRPVGVRGLRVRVGVTWHAVAVGCYWRASSVSYPRHTREFHCHTWLTSLRICPCPTLPLSGPTRRAAARTRRAVAASLTAM